MNPLRRLRRPVLQECYIPYTKRTGEPATVHSVITVYPRLFERKIHAQARAQQWAAIWEADIPQPPAVPEEDDDA